MSFREVNALRKSGDLEAATAMAEHDIEQYRDEWSCKALYWCLNDKAKQLEGNELSECITRMRNLLTTIGDDDIAQSCLQRLERRLIPHMAVVRQAADSAKDPAQAHKAYKTILSIYEAGELDCSLQSDFAWVIYRALHADQSENVELRKELLSKYRELNIERSPILHSLILGEAVRVEKAWPQMFMFTEFIEWWGLDNLTEDDWEQFKTNDGNKLLSRVEKMIYLYTKEVQSISEIQPSAQFMEVLNKAIGKWSTDDNLIRCKALLLTKQGDIDGAIEIYKRIIKLTSGQKYYLWSDLAALVSDIDLKIGLLSKALLLRVQEEFLGKVRTQLAQLLFDKRLYANALYEVQKIEETYQSNGWNVPSNVRLIAQNIPTSTQSYNNTSVYPQWAQKADEFIYTDSQSTHMVKVAHREDYIMQANGKNKKVIKWTLVDNHGESITIKPNKFNLYRADIGTCFEVKKSDNQVIYLSAIDAENVNWRKSFKGSLSVHTNKAGKPFGFADDCYVPGNLLKQVKDGDRVAGVAICTDGKWRCIYIRKL